MIPTGRITLGIRSIPLLGITDGRADLCNGRLPLLSGYLVGGLSYIFDIPASNRRIATGRRLIRNGYLLLA